ncbi:hypothetical protein Lfu02_36840 [Longispora fulva]|nr:hypothetical protein Lfu02_36840 [Longispora fulva]
MVVARAVRVADRAAHRADLPTESAQRRRVDAGPVHASVLFPHDGRPSRTYSSSAPGTSLSDRTNEDNTPVESLTAHLARFGHSSYTR